MALTACSQMPTPSAEAEPQPTATADATNPDLLIKEKMFIAQVNDVYLNLKDYLGKTIRLEGMFFAIPYEPTNSTLFLVIRYGPGCCGNDGQIGFEVAWDDGVFVAPADNSWVEATGVLDEYEESGNMYARLRLTGLRVLEKRGAETVTQ